MTANSGTAIHTPPPLGLLEIKALPCSLSERGCSSPITHGWYVKRKKRTKLRPHSARSNGLTPLIPAALCRALRASHPQLPLQAAVPLAEWLMPSLSLFDSVFPSSQIINSWHIKRHSKVRRHCAASWRHFETDKVGIGNKIRVLFDAGGIRVRTAIITTEETSMSQFHELNMLDIEGNKVDFADYAGKTCLVVNVASA